jgi:Protein-L-isoaspartate(D-aspartate) O-methyltransferase (PCMT)
MTVLVVCQELDRERLGQLGYRPTLVARDGAEGVAEHAPYDPIIVICGMPSLPAGWITQLAPGGLLLVDLEGPLSAGNMAALRRDGAASEVRGRVSALVRAVPAHAPTRDSGRLPPAAADRDTTAPVESGCTTVDPVKLDNEFRFLAQLHLPSGTFHTLTAPPDAQVMGPRPVRPPSSHHRWPLPTSTHPRKAPPP